MLTRRPQGEILLACVWRGWVLCLSRHTHLHSRSHSENAIMTHPPSHVRIPPPPATMRIHPIIHLLTPRCITTLSLSLAPRFVAPSCSAPGQRPGSIRARLAILPSLISICRSGWSPVARHTNEAEPEEGREGRPVRLKCAQCSRIPNVLCAFAVRCHRSQTLECDSTVRARLAVFQRRQGAGSAS